jgi:hypothetical protein
MDHVHRKSTAGKSRLTKAQAEFRGELVADALARRAERNAGTHNSMTTVRTIRDDLVAQLHMWRQQDIDAITAAIQRAHTLGVTEMADAAKKAINAPAPGTPHPEFCRHADKCRGLSACPREIACCAD